MALNDICPDNAVAYRIEGAVIASSDAMPSRRWHNRARRNGQPRGFARETFGIRWSNLTRAELATVRAVWDTYGKTAPLAWTPPGYECMEGRAWCIADYRDGDQTANSCWAEMRLVFMPGVEAPE